MAGSSGETSTSTVRPANAAANTSVVTVSHYGRSVIIQTSAAEKPAATSVAAN